MIKQIPMIKKIKKRTVSPKTIEKNPKRIVSLKVFNKLQKLKKTVIKKIRVGTVCKFKITALGLNNIGIDDRSKKYSVLIPNAKFGQTVKAKILKIHSKQNKYAIARLIEVLDQGSSSEIKILPGSIKEINIEKINEKGTGIVELENNYKLIIPNAKSSIKQFKLHV
jgi:predicted RNA-binding protein with TRAM domain